MTSVNLNYHLKDPISECSHTLGLWGFGLDHVDLGGTQVTLNKRHGQGRLDERAGREGLGQGMPNPATGLPKPARVGREDR